MYRLLRILVLLPLLLMQACDRSPPQGGLKKLAQLDELTVGTLYSQRSFFYDQDDQPTGFEYELLTQFADYLGLHLKLIPLYSQGDLYSALQSNRVDLLAATLSATPSLTKSFRYSPDIYLVDSKLVHKNGDPRIPDLSTVTEPIGVVAGSVHHQFLLDAQLSDPELQIEAGNLSDDELLTQVAQGELSYAVVDDKALDSSQRFNPELAETLTLKQKTPIVWLIQNSHDDALYSALIDFFGQRHLDGTIAKLEEKYFGHIEEFNYFDTKAFLKAVESRLPKYQSWFEQYAGEFDWRLIAAVSYQESHWKPEARSYTGVRGLMMLTQSTAKLVGISNRLDPKQSIQGGCIYLATLIERVPDSIAEDEKIWFALASYNIGFGHMIDARKLTRIQGGDPDSWAEVKERLPLLEDKKWYKQTKYGYARGTEAYQYVKNIRLYYQSLIGIETQKSQQQAEALALQLSERQVEAQRAQLTLKEDIESNNNGVTDAEL